MHLPSQRHELLQKGWCVIIEASEVEVELGKERNPDNRLDYILLDVSFHDGYSIMLNSFPRLLLSRKQSKDGLRCEGRDGSS